MARHRARCRIIPNDPATVHGVRVWGSGTVIRGLTPADWGTFRDIRLDMLQTASTAFGSIHAEWAAKTEQDVRDWLSLMHGFGHMADGRCLAVGAWYRLAGAVRQHRGEVIAVYTRPDARGQGLCAKIM